MKKYYIENDEIIFAETAEEFMRELRMGSMLDIETPEIIYLMEFFERIETFYGETINCTVYDYDGWVRELIRIGFIRKVEDFQPNLN